MMPSMRPDPGISGKSAIVTGGSRGIGRAIALLLAAEGADVTFFYRGNATAADAVVAEGRAAGHRIAALQVDIRDSKACAAAVEGIAERCSRIDILVNNAGTIRDNPLAAFDDDDVAVVLDTNVTGVFNVTRAVVPYMVSQRMGRIVNISSVAGEKGGRGQTNYAASKGAINAFTRALAVELAPRKINVNCVAPGVIDTDMSKDVREMAGDERQGDEEDRQQRRKAREHRTFAGTGQTSTPADRERGGGDGGIQQGDRPSVRPPLGREQVPLAHEDAEPGVIHAHQLRAQRAPGHGPDRHGRRAGSRGEQPGPQPRVGGDERHAHPDAAPQGRRRMDHERGGRQRQKNCQKCCKFVFHMISPLISTGLRKRCPRNRNRRRTRRYSCLLR